MFEPLSREFLDRPDEAERRVLEGWRNRDLLHATTAGREGAPAFVFYEGPPTANGKPGIHHLLARTLKDAVCRFHAMRGERVLRKAGWDTHGLPVELQVEKELGISGKPEIEALGIERFNRACRESVFTYKEEWERLSTRIGYLLDYDDPYVTFHPDYIESVWFLLSRFARNGLLYRGHKVLPWCGRCGTGLSSHEVGQGYRELDDPSVWVSFPLREGPDGARPEGLLAGAALVAWTTTPWTLPSNMGACVHPDLEYAVVEAAGGRWVLLAERADEVFGVDGWRVLGRVLGRELVGLGYEPLFHFEGGRVVHEGDRVHVVLADDYVTAEEGTGVVHLAPYGADDFRLALQEGIQATLAVGEDARLLCEVAGVPAGTFFRDANKPLADDLKRRGRLLLRRQYRHSYPHCWRCETPLIYFPAPAWFLRTTAYKERMVAENRRIRWAPPEIGSGRFGEWLENNIDWALSRDRYWGTPLPVWMCDRDEGHWHCVESFAELAELAGGLPEPFDPHRPVVDRIEFPCRTADCAGTMRRVPQVIDCWFDSGAMPFAQYHWPFENRDLVAEQFPASFIAEGLDQTRGWFYTLHAIAVFLTTVDEDLWASGRLWGEPLPRLEPGGAYRSCLVNGLLLDRNGQKMSKRLGNTVDPWQAVAEHGVDSVRWSLLAGGAAHLSRRYDDQAIAEVRRRILGTLAACYDFLALYARSEGWNPADGLPPRAERPAIDRWILSRAAAAATACVRAWSDLVPADALRALQRFIVDELSNWYVRRCRRRFWGNDGRASQEAAFATLYEVLGAVVRLVAPVTPFLADALWGQLHPDRDSVHLERYPDPDDPEEPTFDPGRDRDPALEAAMEPILRAAGLGRAVREKVRIRLRQPLPRLILHVAGEDRLPASPRHYEEALREELNVKEVEWVEGTPDFLQVRAKPNYPRLGKRAGKDMKALAAAIAELDRDILFRLQGGEEIEVEAGAGTYRLAAEDVIIETLSVEGLEAATDGLVTIGLVTEIDETLAREGLARELVNRIQNQRKESGLEVSDRIRLRLGGSAEVGEALAEHRDWIAGEVLAEGGLEWAGPAGAAAGRCWELPGGLEVRIELERMPAAAN
ncbi:MAG: isoleucine--tRNA ligase [Planctomycetota bacterium]|nr:MAG: isoleucine--tRNA ligase [Planctomycetota bacterium]